MSLFDLNRATLIGNITRDPELTYTAKGTALLKFGIATNRSIKNETGQYQDVPTYHNIVSWAKLAERIAKVAKKGTKVYIEGRIDNRSYEKDGITRYASDVVADNVIVFDRGGNSQYSSSSSRSNRQQSNSSMNDIPEEPQSSSSSKKDEAISPDDIPF